VVQEDLSAIESKTYEIIKKAGEIQLTNLPDPRMMGAVSNLKAKGMVTIFRKYTSRFHKRKKKFAKVKKSQE